MIAFNFIIFQCNLRHVSMWLLCLAAALLCCSAPKIHILFMLIDAATSNICILYVCMHVFYFHLTKTIYCSIWVDFYCYTLCSAECACVCCMWHNEKIVITFTYSRHCAVVFAQQFTHIHIYIYKYLNIKIYTPTHILIPILFA